MTVWAQRFVNIPEAASVRLEKLSGPICVDDNYVLPAKNIKRASRGVSYELNSIIAHIGGSIDGGHYVAVVRKKVENVWKWYCCNDATAYEISKEELEIFKSYGYVFSFVKST
ncbi:MAG: ubiquitin carboxyl-terminal hydrolase [Chlamydiae bacterium]|nr:ubiquitin carboxyl-terminal hydrolase [Chlamydiota bacterium]